VTATYSDIIDAMIEAEKRDLSIDHAVLTSESMESFLTDDTFSETCEQEQKDVIGEEWELEIESGDGNYLQLKNGSKIQL